MTRNDDNDDDNGDEDIQIAFKRLKVDSEREDSSFSEQCVDIHSIWSGESKKSRSAEPSPKRPKHRVSPSRRSLPYPTDCVLSFERLCLRKEKCSKKWCLCEHDKSKNSSSSPDSKLNFAVAVGGQRKLIQEAKLKLNHHAQKDHRQIIRAARLQLNEAKRCKTTKELHKKAKEKTNTTHVVPDKIFGSVTKQDSLDFSNVPSTSKKTIFDNPLPDKHFFDGYRSSNIKPTTTPSVDKSRSSLSKDSSSTTEISPGKVEKSCSQEATIDDLSVDELAGYFDDFVHIPKKMSVMAEMMYT